MLDELAVQILKLLPKNLLSRGMGALSEVSLPQPLQLAVNAGFAKAAGVDTEEARRRLTDYGSLNEFFTRQLKDSARPIQATDASDLVSPVDGTLSSFGGIDGGTLLQAKGRSYDLMGLFDSGRDAAIFEGGSFATLYLSPTDYHRIHSPVAGRIGELSYIPGHLFPVNPFAVEHIDRLFAVNERLISYIHTARGPVAVVKVGATCVGRIQVTKEGLPPVETNRPRRRRRLIRESEPVDVAPGEELAVFNLGSTVILLIADEAFGFDDGLDEGQAIRMGTLLGRFKGAAE